ncbi:hypothetical protein R1flu_022078 [Riccia fluitans]|uniref:Uncharacterized protein n=1 Tax=Riccia fluitans TaxID=41844 RepID=A0ABD1ZRI5_9MARC
MQRLTRQDLHPRKLTKLEKKLKRRRQHRLRKRRRGRRPKWKTKCQQPRNLIRMKTKPMLKRSQSKEETSEDKVCRRNPTDKPRARKKTKMTKKPYDTIDLSNDEP